MDFAWSDEIVCGLTTNLRRSPLTGTSPQASANLRAWNPIGGQRITNRGVLSVSFPLRELLRELLEQGDLDSTARAVHGEIESGPLRYRGASAGP